LMSVNTAGHLITPVSEVASQPYQRNVAYAN
jgi:hypothetical protein